MSYVLDTNAVSAIMKGDARMLEHLRSKSRTSILVPQPVFAEIAYGIERLAKSKRRDSLRVRFELVKEELARCEWTDEVSAAFGAIKASLEKRGQRIEDFDAAIAAHALARRAVLVTANLEHMLRVPDLSVEDWCA